jgi:hypothetical protein
MSIPTPFIPVDEPLEEVNVSQLTFLTVIYAYVIFQASGFISDGSELLLLIPSVAGLVGSIVLPILGAVPDGVMMLFSGASAHPQEDIASGVGVLAGSTVMLLTLPWVIAILFGGVPIGEDGTLRYGRHEGSACGKGIAIDKSIKKGAKIMVLTTLLYLIIQIPASSYEAEFPKTKDGSGTKKQGDAEANIAAAGFVACCVAFFGYLFLCYKEANTDLQMEKIIEGIMNKTVSLGAALNFVKDRGEAGGSRAFLLDKETAASLKYILRPFFRRYDDNNDKTLDQHEFRFLMRDLGEGLSEQDSATLFMKYDNNKSGDISFDEFTQCVVDTLSAPHKMAKFSKAPNFNNDDDDEEEEEEEVPEDLADLPPDQQKKKILLRSAWMMSFGVALVLIFADPLVECFTHWGNAVLGVSPFYISFVLAPLASNASELIAAYNYACKKTAKGITTSLSTLIGAACMNNTFCLAIFFVLIYAQGIAWQFTAETIAIIVSQWVIAALAIFKSVHTTKDAIIILAVYPATMALVYVLENSYGLD